jgi:hypothetical protein
MKNFSFSSSASFQAKERRLRLFENAREEVVMLFFPSVGEAGLCCQPEGT